MSIIARAAGVAMAAALAAAPVLAQDSGAGSAADPTLSLGEADAAPADAGQVYVAGEHGDWSLRCIRNPDGADPCNLYQLLHDADGNAVAEINIFDLAGNPRAAAGATIATPLDTLLSRQLGLNVDGGVARRYPFTYCTAQGCYARIGLTDAELETFRRGQQAQVTIVPLAAPDKEVTLTISLKGFTAGFDALAKMTAGQ